jgi:hypothetical protein
VEKLQADFGSSPSPDNENQLTFTRERAQARLARFEEKREEAKKKRRAGRPKGELTQSLTEKLSNCNVLQLQSVKKLCDGYIKRQRKPPVERACGHPSTVRVLHSVTVRTMRFQLEFHRTSFRGEKVYINGPYVWRYWRDGSIVNSKYIKKDKDLRRNLPKKVWLAFKDLLDRPENEDIRQELIQKLERALGTGI